MLLLLYLRPCNLSAIQKYYFPLINIKTIVAAGKIDGTAQFCKCICWALGNETASEKVLKTSPPLFRDAVLSFKAHYNFTG